MISLQQPTSLRQLTHFLRTTKGVLLLILALFTVLGLLQEGSAGVVTVIAAVTAVVLLDLAIVRTYEGRWQFPDGAILTALIIALVMRTQEPLSVATAAAIIAILSKYLLRTRWSNIFNPAAFGLVAVALIFHSGESWWGGLSNLGMPGLVLLALAGVFIANHLNKLPLVLTFLGGFLFLATTQSFLGHSTQVAELFRTPDVQALLFFSFFMLDDPPTCPIHYEDQIMFGALCAVVSYVAFISFGPDYFLLVGLLTANAWESARRLLIGRLTSATRSLDGRLSLTAVAVAGLLACVLPLSASASSPQAHLPSTPQTAQASQAATSPALPIPGRGEPRDERGRDREGDDARGLVVFTGVRFENGWRLSSPQFPGEVLEILSSGQVQLLDRETRQADYLGSSDVTPINGRGALHIVLDGKGLNSGLRQRIDGTFDVVSANIRLTSRVTRSGLNR